MTWGDLSVSQDDWIEQWSYPFPPSYTDFRVNDRNIFISGTFANVTCTIHAELNGGTDDADCSIELTKVSSNWLIESLIFYSEDYRMFPFKFETR